MRSGRISHQALYHRLVRKRPMKCVAVLLAGVSVLDAETFDVVVYGATPGGIAAAVTAARMNHRVALAEYHRHIGGMSASGLGRSDIDTREAIGGLFREFVDKVYRHYVNTYGAGHEIVRLSNHGYHYEPSVGQKILDEIVAAEPRIKVFRGHRLDKVVRAGQAVTAIRVAPRNAGAAVELRGTVFVDGTYEGDLAAYAGARYRVGRESRTEFNELHAGVVFQDHQADTFLAGSTGQGDRGIQAYTYRPCLTDDPANAVPFNSPPPEYDRTVYLPYLADIKAGRLTARGGTPPMARAITIGPLPNHKFDINIRPVALAYPFVEVNFEYPEANWEKREVIATRIRNLTLGLFYFMQNDPALTEEERRYMRRYALPKDEFADNGHFPWQLYVREARRIIGEYTLNQNDLTLAPGLDRAPVFFDSVAAGEYPIDSMPVHKRADDTGNFLEGYINRLVQFTRPYQLPMRIMVPKGVDGLLVPVAASATHVAFSSIRMEPTWMALGQAAGVAAHLAIRDRKRVRDLRPEPIQRLLLRQGQVLTYFRDIDPKDPSHDAIQFLGTRGFFTSYQAGSGQAVTRGLGARWLALVLATAGIPLDARRTAARLWRDVEPGAPFDSETRSLVTAGVLKSAPDSRFEPDLPLDRQEFQTWICAAGRRMRLWDAKADCGANGLDGSSGAAPAGEGAVTRGEFCRAAFALLEKAGY